MKRIFRQGAVDVTLNGDLGFVPLDEVLRLLTRSEQHGSVHVEGDEFHGRIFIGRDGIGLATIFDDKTMRRNLLNSGYVAESELNDVEAGRETLDVSSEEFHQLLREITIESVYQMQKRGKTFDVLEAARSPYAAPAPFDLELVLSAAENRIAEWSHVSNHVTDLNANLRLVRDLGDRDEVKIDRDTWRLLSEMGTEASVSALASQLGTTDYWAAKIVAGLKEKELVRNGVLPTAVHVDQDRDRSQTSVVEETPSIFTAEPAWTVEGEIEGTSQSDYTMQAPTDSADETSDDAESEVDWPALAQSFDDESEATVRNDTSDPESDSERSWWEEPEPHLPAGMNPDDSESEEESEPEPDKGGRLGQFAAALNREALESRRNSEHVTEDELAEAEDQFDDVEDDTEAFLEKVFSELETTENDDASGHGLLRRRKLGSSSREAD